MNRFIVTVDSMQVADPDRTLGLPHLGDVGVLGLVPEEWGGPWQPRHHVLTRLAEFFHVVWVNPPAERGGWWRHQAFVGRDLSYNSHPAGPGFTVNVAPKWLPLFHRPRSIARMAAKQRLQRARDILVRQGCRKIILYVWRPEYASALDLLNHDVSCYHIDDEYTFSAIEQPVDDREAKLIAQVDQVIIHSPALLQKKGHLNPRTLFVPNGADYKAYATRREEPSDLRGIPHPRIGYVGKIKTQLDFKLLIELANRHPEWSFVFVGARGFLGDDVAAFEVLSQLANVYFLGAKPVDELPGYIQHLDVCMLCYVVNDYTKFIYPLKLHEYLASGRPVVGVPIRSLLDFPHVVTLAGTCEEWSRAIADALLPSANAPEQVEARRRVARAHDWTELVRRIAGAFCDQLGPTYLDRLEQIPS